jgi:lipoprotein-releasing system ATP-binding protein
MIAGKNIHKRYDTIQVLKGVDIEIKKGEIASIVGPSGSGKSTLLHILGTLDKADQGYVEMNGVKIENTADPDIVPVSWQIRTVNWIIDRILIICLVPVFMILAGKRISFTGSELYSVYMFLITSVTAFVYYSVWEGLTGRTPGKLITQTKIFNLGDSSRPGFVTGVLRSLCRFIPFEVFSLFSQHPVGWHDSLPGTIVASSKFQYRKRALNSLSSKQLSLFRNKHIGFVFQFHHLLPEFTALENVCIPGWLAGRSKNEVRKEATRLLNMLGLSHRMENKPNQLSGGEQQRVAVARALINKPDIVFADEPTGNLDSANAQELHKLFFDLRDQFNQTFLIVTHNEELAKLSDRVLYMRDGKIV